MSTKAKWIISIFCLLIVSVLSWLVYRYWIPIKSFFTQKKFYTEEECQDYYDKGLADGNKSSGELQERLDYYLELVNTIPELERSIATKTSQIDTLNVTISDLRELNTQLSTRLETLNSERETFEDVKSGLISQISELNEMILIKIDEVQAIELEKYALDNELANKLSLISSLEQDIDYYENYINGSVDSEHVIARFIFDGNVYSIQILNKNSIASISDPVDTTYIHFNYWTIDGTNEVILNTYTLSQNTVFIANTTKYYDVKFTVDGTEIQNTAQIIENGNSATAPANPTKDGYVFDGWTIDGVNLVNPNITIINSNTTFIAKFRRINVVEFVFDGTVISRQSVLTGNNPSAVNISSYSENYVFNYWTLNGVRIDDVTSYVVSDEYNLFVANFTRKYTVQFKVDDQIISTQKVVDNNLVSTIPNNPTKNGYHFVGWVITGNDIVNLNTYIVNSDVIFIANFTDNLVVTLKSDGVVFDTVRVRSGNTLTYSNIPTKTGYMFRGWSLNGTDVIDLANTVINNDTTLHAVWLAVDFNMTISSDNATLLQNTTRDGVGFYSYKYLTDLSQYVTSNTIKPFDIGLTVAINGVQTFNISEMGYTNLYSDMHYYNYNYYPNNNDNNTYYAITIEVYASYVRYAVMFYGNVNTQNALSFESTLHLHALNI